MSQEHDDWVYRKKHGHWKDRGDEVSVLPDWVKKINDTREDGNWPPGDLLTAITEHALQSRIDELETVVERIDLVTACTLDDLADPLEAFAEIRKIVHEAVAQETK